MIKKLVVFILLIVAIIAIYKFNFAPKPKEEAPAPQISQDQIYQDVSYVPVDKSISKISIFTDKITTPTRLKISPDGKYLFVTSLSGQLYVFKKTNSGWDANPTLLTKIDTHFPGFPPEEAGLTGFIFSSQYSQNHKLFLLYSYQDKDKSIKNRISVTTISNDNGVVSASNPKLIFQANVNGSPSHQITDGLGINLEDSPHLLVLIGEGFDASRAQDPHLEAGKVLLIKEDGSNPDGVRPFKENPKVQALGIRNAFVLSPSPNLGKLLIADTGPDKYDRLIALPFPTFNHNRPINLNWNGDQESLAIPVPDPDGPPIKDLVIHRLPQTRTFTGLAFLPVINQNQTFLATMFGQTGSPNNTPGKEIWLGTITHPYSQPQVRFKTLITRAKQADGKLGNPLGLALDQDQDFFFADVLESRIYFVTTNFEGR